MGLMLFVFQRMKSENNIVAEKFEKKCGPTPRPVRPGANMATRERGGDLRVMRQTPSVFWGGGLLYCG